MNSQYNILGEDGANMPPLQNVIYFTLFYLHFSTVAKSKNNNVAKRMKTAFILELTLVSRCFRVSKVAC